MENISVSFEMPSYIRKGLEAGSFERYGGVIRDNSGQVVHHLVETGLESAPELINVAQEMKLLNLVQGLSLATNMLSLGVMTVGFAVLNHKMNLMNKKLDSIKNDLKRIETKIDDIAMRKEIQLLTKFQTAITIGELAAMSSNDQQNRYIKAQYYFISVQQEMRGLMEAHQKKYGIVPIYQEYSYRGLVCVNSGLAAAKCSLYRNENDIAKKIITDTAIHAKKMLDDYQHSFNPRNLEALQKPHSEIPKIKQHRDEFIEARNRLETAEAQIDYLINHSISYMQIEEICSKSSNNAKGPVAYVGMAY